MLDLLLAGLAGLQLGGGDAQVQCQLNATPSANRIEALSAECPDGLDPADTETIQGAADAFLARVDEGSHYRDFLDEPVEDAPVYPPSEPRDLVMLDGEVVCELEASDSGPRRGPEELTAQCPEGAAEVQRAADAVLASLDMNFPRLERGGQYQLSQNLIMIANETGWSAAPGQVLVRAKPAFPLRAAEQGSTHMLCAVGVIPGADGRIVEAPIDCIADVEQAERAMEQATRDALAGWRLAPVDIEYCMEEQFYMPATIIVRGGQEHRPNPLPDPARLPPMC